MTFPVFLFLLIAISGFVESGRNLLEPLTGPTTIGTPAPYPISYLNRHGIVAFDEHNLQEFYKKTPIYLRDIMSAGFVGFDLPAHSLGFYPVSPMKLVHPHNHIEVNASNVVQMAFFKCGFIMQLGQVFRGRVLYDNEDVKALESVDCGAQRNEQHVKLMIRTLNRRSRGWAKLEREDINDNSIFDPWYLLAFGLIAVIIAFCMCICKRRKKSRFETASDKWIRADSFTYNRIPPCPDDLFGTSCTILGPRRREPTTKPVGLPPGYPASVSTFCPSVRFSAPEIMITSTMV